MQAGFRDRGKPTEQVICRFGFRRGPDQAIRLGAGGPGSRGGRGGREGVSDAGEVEAFEILYVRGGELGHAGVAQHERGAGAFPTSTRHSRSVRFFWRDAPLLPSGGESFRRLRCVD